MHQSFRRVKARQVPANRGTLLGFDTRLRPGSYAKSGRRKFIGDTTIERASQDEFGNPWADFVLFTSKASFPLVACASAGTVSHVNITHKTGGIDGSNTDTNFSPFTIDFEGAYGIGQRGIAGRYMQSMFDVYGSACCLGAKVTMSYYFHNAAQTPQDGGYWIVGIIARAGLIGTAKSAWEALVVSFGNRRQEHFTGWRNTDARYLVSLKYIPAQQTQSVDGRAAKPPPTFTMDLIVDPLVLRANEMAHAVETGAYSTDVQHDISLEQYVLMNSNYCSYDPATDTGTSAVGDYANPAVSFYIYTANGDSSAGNNGIAPSTGWNVGYVSFAFEQSWLFTEKRTHADIHEVEGIGEITEVAP